MLFPRKIRVSRDYTASRRLQQSGSRAITMHQQICQTKDGRLVYKDLKLYMSYGQQCARTYREKPVQHFVKEGRWWRQFK